MQKTKSLTFLPVESHFCETAKLILGFRKPAWAAKGFGNQLQQLSWASRAYRWASKGLRTPQKGPGNAYRTFEKILENAQFGV